MRNCILVYVSCACVLFGAGSASANNTPDNGGGAAFSSKADILFSAIQSFIVAKDYEQAESIALELTETYSNYNPGWMILGHCRTLAEDYTGSNEAYETALSIGADEMEIYARMAYNYVKLKDWMNAIKTYQKILDIDYVHMEALLQLAHLNGQIGNYSEAAFYYEKVLHIDPNNVDVMGALAKADEKLGENAEARFWIERGLKIDPGNKKLLLRYSVLLLNEQNFKEALPYLQKLIMIDPDNPSLHKNLGIAYYGLDRKRDAIKAFDKVRSNGGNLKGVYGPYAESCREVGDNRLALTVVKEGILAENQEAWLYSIWGKILEDAKNYDGAIEKFKRVVELQEEPWGDFAKKQIARQIQLKKRAELMAAQAAGK